jgi:hypothetical protein
MRTGPFVLAKRKAFPTVFRALFRESLHPNSVECVGRPLTRGAI